MKRNMTDETIKTKSIHQSITFKASPYKIYEALMDSKKHSQFTGDETNISRKIGGRLTAGSGYIAGGNIELIADEEIVPAVIREEN